MFIDNTMQKSLRGGEAILISHLRVTQNMIGLVIVLLLTNVVCFAFMTAIVQAYEEKEKKIHLEEIQIQTPEQEAALETLK